MIVYDRHIINDQIYTFTRDLLLINVNNTIRTVFTFYKILQLYKIKCHTNVIAAGKKLNSFDFRLCSEVHEHVQYNRTN